MAAAAAAAHCLPRTTPPQQNLEKPDEDEVERVARETAAALVQRVDKKQAVLNPKTLPSQPGSAQYIKYTPADAGPAHASGAASRIIKMQDMPVDPLEPPKFRHLKVRRGWAGLGRMGCLLAAEIAGRDGGVPAGVRAARSRRSSGTAG